MIVTIDSDLIERAQKVSESTKHSDAADALAYFEDWAREDPAEVARIAFVLAMVVDHKMDLVQMNYRVNVPEELRIKAQQQAHALYCRGAEFRTPAVMAGEAAYQRRMRGDRRAPQRRRKLKAAQAVVGLRSVAKAKQELPQPAERRAIREASGMSLADMGEFVGVDRGAVSKWERGLRMPTGERLVDYVFLLNSLRQVPEQSETSEAAA